MKRLLQILAAVAVIGGVVALAQNKRQLPAPEDGIWKPVGPT